MDLRGMFYSANYTVEGSKRRFSLEMYAIKKPFPANAEVEPSVIQHR